MRAGLRFLDGHACRRWSDVVGPWRSRQSPRVDVDRRGDVTESTYYFLYGTLHHRYVLLSTTWSIYAYRCSRSFSAGKASAVSLLRLCGFSVCPAGEARGDLRGRGGEGGWGWRGVSRPGGEIVSIIIVTVFVDRSGYIYTRAFSVSLGA